MLMVNITYEPRIRANQEGLAVADYGDKVVIRKTSVNDKPQQLNLTKRQASDLHKMLAAWLESLKVQAPQVTA